MNNFDLPSGAGDRTGHAAMTERESHAGFTLVELMVALAIASLLLGALAVMFVNTSVARGELDKSSRQIETGRYAMQVLADEIRHAGYYGALSNAPSLPGSVTSLPDPCPSDVTTIKATVQNSLAIPIQGYAGATTAANLDTGKLACLDAAAGYKANTAVLVVRRADTKISAAVATAGFFNIQVSGCPGDSNRYVLDTDTAATFVLHSNGSPGCTPITSAPLAKLTPLYQRIYFISTCSGSNCSAAGADSVPTLKRIDITPTGASAPIAIIDGIENLQIDYGIDTSAPGDGSPDTYTNTSAHTAVTPSSMGEWLNVMAVRLYILARNLDTSAGFTDTKTYVLGPVSLTPGGSFRRHAYNEVVRLNNPAGRRE
jgi:type IV pilus assembly protein PilW